METENSRRTRAIKGVLVSEFGRKNVSVRQGQGTAHNWVYVRVCIPKEAPQDLGARLREEADVRGKVEKIIGEAGIQLSQYATDYGPASQKHPYESCLSVSVEFSQ